MKKEYVELPESMFWYRKFEDLEKMGFKIEYNHEQFEEGVKFGRTRILVEKWIYDSFN